MSHEFNFLLADKRSRIHNRILWVESKSDKKPLSFDVLKIYFSRRRGLCSRYYTELRNYYICVDGYDYAYYSDCCLRAPADNIQAGLYDPRDIQRLDTDDAYARCFLRTLKARGNVEKATETVHESFKFRKELGIWGQSAVRLSYSSSLFFACGLCQTSDDCALTDCVWWRLKWSAVAKASSQQ